MKHILKRVFNRVFILLNGMYYSVFNSKAECPVCQYKTNRFNSDKWHQYTVCPKCGLGVRHRLLIASLLLLKEYNFDKIITKKKVLHFAPEEFMKKLFMEHSADYKTADFISGGYVYKNIDYNLDISNMPAIKSESVDCIIACDVLEHVTDDRQAILEVFRVLRPSGYGIFTVPQQDNLKTTYGDPAIVSPEEREQKFGQYDHLRIYGNDFADQLRAGGFEVFVVDEHLFDQKTADRFVLYPPVLSDNPLATNYRKIFFAHKKQKPDN